MSMRRKAALIAGAIVILSAAAVLAEIHKDKAAGVTYDIPSWWKSEQREQGMVLATQDDSVVIMIWTPQDTTLKDAVAKLDRELAGVISGAKVNGPPESGSLNGMETLSVAGKGRVNRARVEYTVIVVDAKRPLIVLAFGEVGRYERHNDEIAGFIKTIKRAK